MTELRWKDRKGVVHILTADNYFTSCWMWTWRTPCSIFTKETTTCLMCVARA